jgi:hypothetical protein
MKIEKNVFNPNFEEDVKKFFSLSLSVDEISKIINKTNKNYPLSQKDIIAGKPDKKIKLKTFIDRYEFIHHLKIFSDYAKNNKFNINGEEVVGVDWDIEALRLYLALTLIDIFIVGENHKDHFISVFNNISQNLKSEMTNNLKIICENKDIIYEEDFAEYFYCIRNSYTHAGIRFQFDTTVRFNLTQKFIVGSNKNKRVKELQIEKGFNLTGFILKVAVENAKRVFGW